MTKELEHIWRDVFVPWIAGGGYTITPLFYQGAMAGTEFTIYAATKLYLVSALDVSSPGSSSINNPTVPLYDATNAVFDYIHDTDSHWDVTAGNQRTFGNNITYSNLYFSRIVGNVVYTNMKFIGYRIDIV